MRRVKTLNNYQDYPKTDDCSSMVVLMFRNESWFDLDRCDEIPLNSIRIHLVELLATSDVLSFNSITFLGPEV